MSKHLVILVLALFTLKAAQADVNIIGYHHPPKEPSGLYIVNFAEYGGGVGTDYYGEYTYRIYCPTKMVRDTSSGKMGASRTASQEDSVSFGNARVLRQVINRICK